MERKWNEGDLYFDSKPRHRSHYKYNMSSLHRNPLNMLQVHFSLPWERAKISIFGPKWVRCITTIWVICTQTIVKLLRRNITYNIWSLYKLLWECLCRLELDQRLVLWDDLSSQWLPILTCLNHLDPSKTLVHVINMSRDTAEVLT